jgi:hypothetical protein
MDRLIQIPGGRWGRRTTRMATTLGALLIAVAAGTTTAGAATPSATPPAMPSEPNVPWDDGALEAQVRTDLVNVHPRMWDHILLAQDGQTATVYFWMGPTECAGLAGVDVKPNDTGYRVIVEVGDVAGAAPCTDVVQLYRSVVELDDRLLTGGEVLDLPGGDIPTFG